MGKIPTAKSHYYDKHIKSCNFCAKLVSNVKKIPHSELEKKVARITQALAEDKIFNQERRTRGCPTTGEMMAYIHGKLHKKRIYIENHIQKCKNCREEVKIIEKIEKNLGENN